MSNPFRLDYNIDHDAWEPVTYYDASGNGIVWQGVVTFDGQTDTNLLYQADVNGNLFQVETGALDNSVPIKIRLATKRFPTDQIALVKEVFVRLTGVADTATLTVKTGGSEYGDVTRTYTIDLSGSGDVEIKTSVERELLGRWIQLQIDANVSNRVAFRDLVIWYIAHRNMRVSAPM